MDTVAAVADEDGYRITKMDVGNVGVAIGLDV